MSDDEPQERGTPDPGYPLLLPPPPPAPSRGTRWPWIAVGVLLLAAIVVVVVSVSESGDDEITLDRPEATVTPPGSDTGTTDAEVTTTTAEPPSRVPDSATEYFEAFASDDLSRMGAMLDEAVDESPAGLYATHQIASTRALGQTGSQTTVEEDGESIVLRSTDYDLDGNEVEETATYSDFEMEGDRLAGFSVEGVSVADRIRAGDPTGSSNDGVTVRIVTAYVNIRGDLVVNVDITNTRSDVLEVADYEWSLITSDGRQVAPSENVCCPIAPSVQPEATAGHVVYFEQVGFGGSLQFVAFADDFVTEVRFDVPVPS